MSSAADFKLIDSSWQHAPWPALWVEASAVRPRVQANSAASLWATQHDCPLRLLEDAAASCALTATHSIHQQRHTIAGVDVSCTAVQLDDGAFVVWLKESSLAHEAGARAGHLSQEVHEHRALVTQAIGTGFWSGEYDAQGTECAVQWDEQLCAIYGCSATAAPASLAQWLGKHVFAEDRSWLKQRLDLAAAQAEYLTELRYRIVTPAGQLRWVNSWSHRLLRHGRLAIFGMELDVTEAQQALHDQQRAQQREQYAIDVAGVGIWERDAAGKVLFWNRAMYRLLGLSPDDPRDPDALMAQATIAQDYASDAQCYAEEIARGQPYRRESRIQGSEGQPRWILTHGRPMRDAAGHVVGMAGINVDITSRKAADLLEAEKQLAEHNSREKSAFMARMSHELRTPLNAVLGYAQLLQRDLESPPSDRQRQRLLIIEEAGQRLLQLTDNLLETARREPMSAPTATQESAAGKPTSTEDPTPSSPAMRLLCVEDNPVNLQLVRELLGMRPHIALTCAEDGQTAIARATANPPDVVLLDLQLPDISGHEVYRQLRRHPALERCRFIALSADALPASIVATRAEGFDDYWTKPIEFERFLQNLDRLVAETAMRR